MLLRVVGDYRSDAVAFHSGQLIDVTDAEGEFLLRDSPGSFKKAVEEKPVPSVDRQGRGGRTRG